jgi:hypothetical protein
VVVHEPVPITGSVVDGSVEGVEEPSIGSVMVVGSPVVDEESMASTTPATAQGAMRPGRNSNTGRNCRRVRMGTLRP